MADDNFQIVALRADEIADHYEEVGAHATHLQPVWERILGLLEGDEVRHFNKMKGRYVLTGETFRSLTQPFANGAIRQVHGDGLVFGTRVLQAHYLTKSPHDAGNYQVTKHNGKRSAVLVQRPDTRKLGYQMIADFVTEPFGE